MMRTAAFRNALRQAITDLTAYYTKQASQPDFDPSNVKWVLERLTELRNFVARMEEQDISTILSRKSDVTFKPPQLF